MRMRRRGPGLVGMAARTAVVAGTATAVSGRVARRQANRYAEKDAAYDANQQALVDQQYAAQQAAGPAPADAGGGGDYMAELEQLNQLKQQGVITERGVRGEEEADPRDLSAGPLRAAWLHARGFVDRVDDTHVGNGVTRRGEVRRATADRGDECLELVLVGRPP